MVMKGFAIGAALAGVLSLSAAPAFAAEDDHDSGFYLGAALGDFSANYRNSNDVQNTHLHFNRNDASRILGGWRFMPYLAVQLDYSDFGRSTTAASELGLTTNSDAWTPSIIGTLPIGPVELFGKVGESFYNVTANNNTGRLVDSSDHDPVYGVGIGITVIKRLNISAEYERIKMNQYADADAVWLTASWRFAAPR